MKKGQIQNLGLVVDKLICWHVMNKIMGTERAIPGKLYKLDGEQGTSEIWRKQTELEKERMKKKD